jgi:hypothetical protein
MVLTGAALDWIDSLPHCGHEFMLSHYHILLLFDETPYFTVQQVRT